MSSPSWPTPGDFYDGMGRQMIDEARARLGANARDDSVALSYDPDPELWRTCQLLALEALAAE